MPRDGRYIEKLGTYNPLLPKDHDDRLTLDLERAKHWISQGAKPSDRIARFLDDAGLWKREARNNPQKGKPGAKALERLEAAEEAKRAAEKKPPPLPQHLRKRHRKHLRRGARKKKRLRRGSAEEAAAEEAPAERGSSEEAPAEETTAEEALADEEPAEDASDEEGEKDA